MATKIAVCSLWSLCPYKQGQPQIVSRQCSSNQTARQQHPSKRFSFMPSVDSKHDWIGPPNRLSNLRPIIHHFTENETELEKRLRNLRQETEDWNHTFWTKQNVTFRKEMEAYIHSHLKAQGLSEHDEEGHKRTLDSERMAVFYKSFLDKNRVRHANYNKEWYQRNFTITMLMGRVALHNIWTTIAPRQSANKKNSTTT